MRISLEVGAYALDDRRSPMPVGDDPLQSGDHLLEVVTGVRRSPQASTCIGYHCGQPLLDLVRDGRGEMSGIEDVCFDFGDVLRVGAAIVQQYGPHRLVVELSITH